MFISNKPVYIRGVRRTPHEQQALHNRFIQIIARMEENHQAWVDEVDKNIMKAVKREEQKFRHHVRSMRPVVQSHSNGNGAPKRSVGRPRKHQIQ